MSNNHIRILLILGVSAAIVGCSGGKKKPTSPANNISNAGSIPIPCPPGQTTDTFTDAQGHQITLNCTAATGAAPGTTTTPATTTSGTKPVQTSSI
jgi:ABC-type molybdate transport system substrate-binding protein